MKPTTGKITTEGKEQPGADLVTEEIIMNHALSVLYQYNVHYNTCSSQIIYIIASGKSWLCHGEHLK